MTRWILSLVVLAAICNVAPSAHAQTRNKKQAAAEQAAEVKKKQDEARQAAGEAAGKWLALMDAGKYADAYQTMPKALQQLLSSEQWETITQAARAPLGPVVFRKVVNVQYTEAGAAQLAGKQAFTQGIDPNQLKAVPFQEWVFMQSQVRFQNLPVGLVETVTMVKDEDGQWRALGAVMIGAGGR